MENILILMWLADIASGVRTLSFVCLIIWATAMLLAAVDVFGNLDNTRTWRRTMWFPVLMLALSLLTPAPNTIRMLAAAEVSSTPLGAKALEAMNAILDKVKSK
jgi:hypothetical protein